MYVKLSQRPDPLVDWLEKKGFRTDRMPQMAGTSISTAVDLAREGIAYLFRREKADTLLERGYNALSAYTYLTESRDHIKNKSRKGELMFLNANRDGKRGTVYTLGALATNRFHRYSIPEIVLREHSFLTTRNIYKISSELYWNGYCVAPLALVAPHLLVSVYVSDNLMQMLGTYVGDRGALEQRLIEDIAQTTETLAREIMRIRVPRGPRVDCEDVLRESVSFLARKYLDESVSEQDIESVARDIVRRDPPIWPFVDPSLRNFGLVTDDQTEPLIAYLDGNARLIHYDPDRIMFPSGRGFNLAHIMYAGWECDTPLPSDENFSGALHYLLRRTARAETLDVPRGSVSARIEEDVLKKERSVLISLMDSSYISRYPLIQRIVTGAAPLWGH